MSEKAKSLPAHFLNAKLPLSRQLLDIQNDRMQSLQKIRQQVRDMTIEAIADKADNLFAQVLIFPCKQLTKATYKLVMIGLNPSHYKEPASRFERQKKRLILEIDRLYEKMEMTIGDYI